MAEYFKEIFPWLITLCQPALSQRGRKWLNLYPTVPHSLWMASEEESQSFTIDRR